MRILDMTRYSITIADDNYNDNYFITPRVFENYMHDIINFTEMPFDKDEHLVSMNDWTRVHDFKEMMEKIGYLKADESEYIRLLKLQRSKITPEITDGSYVYNLLR